MAVADGYIYPFTFHHSSITLQWLYDFGFKSFHLQGRIVHVSLGLTQHIQTVAVTRRLLGRQAPVVLPQLGGSLGSWPGGQHTASYPSSDLAFQCLRTGRSPEPEGRPCPVAWLSYARNRQTAGTSLRNVSPHW